MLIKELSHKWKAFMILIIIEESISENELNQLTENRTFWNEWRRKSDNDSNNNNKQSQTFGEKE